MYERMCQIAQLSPFFSPPPPRYFLVSEERERVEVRTTIPTEARTILKEATDTDFLFEKKEEEEEEDRCPRRGDENRRS